MPVCVLCPCRRGCASGSAGVRVIRTSRRGWRAGGTAGISVICPSTRVVYRCAGVSVVCPGMCSYDLLMMRKNDDTLFYLSPVSLR